MTGADAGSPWRAPLRSQPSRKERKLVRKAVRHLLVATALAQDRWDPTDEQRYLGALLRLSQNSGPDILDPKALAKGRFQPPDPEASGVTVVRPGSESGSSRRPPKRRE